MRRVIKAPKVMNVPHDDTKQIWQQTGHDWNSVESWLKNHKDTSAGIEDTLVEQMLQVAHEKRQSGAEFPQSENELYKLMRKA